MVDDLEAIHRVQAGDTAAFGFLVEKYHRHVLNFIYTLLSDRDRVEDIGQEVFLKAYESIEGFDERRGTPFSAWLFTIARNRCISELRLRRTRHLWRINDYENMQDPCVSGESLLLDRERRRILEESLAILPEPFRGVFVESMRGEKVADIAAKHGISAGTVKSRLSRAKQRLKQFIADHYGDSQHGTV